VSALLWVGAGLALAGASSLLLGLLGLARDRPWMGLPWASTGVGARPPAAAVVQAVARGPAVDAPLTRRPCLGWELTVWASWTQGGEAHEVLAERRVGGRITLDDGSGPLPLALDRLPEGAPVSGLGAVAERSRGLGELGAITARGVEFGEGLRLHPGKGLLGKAERYRVEERLLLADDLLLVHVGPAPKGGGQVLGLRAGPRAAATLRGRRQVLAAQVGGGAALLMGLLALVVGAVGA
jgi:hypothetical protein